MRLALAISCLLAVLACACQNGGELFTCDLDPCGLSSLAKNFPPGRSAVCDSDLPDWPRRWDHCLVWDGAGLFGPYGAIPARNCDDPWRERGDYICAPLKDPVIGGDVLTCEVDGVAARCMWVPNVNVEAYPP